ncbi:MAG: VCBS repeat-containing protein, partial [Myxococcales bacterium]|nr:VCBS repeat-containing protein [Myxococcales bacterium]
MVERARGAGLVVVVMGLSCTDPSSGEEEGSSVTLGPTATLTATGSGSAGTDSDSTSTPTGDGTASETGLPDDTSGIKLDVSGVSDVPLPPLPTCEVVDGMDAVGECGEQALPDSFDPDVQWEWPGQGGYSQSITIALVANLTDDDADGSIDLCDVPDVVVNAFANYGAWDAYLFALDGETGTVHWQSEQMVDGGVTAALGDIDGDGLPELVAVQYQTHNLIAFEHDGSLKWTGANWPGYNFGAIALADLDNDGDVEIVAGNLIADHNGAAILTLGDVAGSSGFGNASAVADLDGDGDQEVVLGRSAFHHDGTQLWSQGSLAVGYPQVANLDADPQPEVLLETANGITVLEHDGAIKYQNLRPTGAPASNNSWMRPSTVHDFDGDGTSEYALSSSSDYSVYEQDASIVWSAPVVDSTGVAAGTAFDFLGDGVAEAMYADETNLYIYDGTGTPLLQVPRSSGTIIEYPVVADVDND